MNTLEAALQAAGRGWQVIPLHEIVNGICGCDDGARCNRAGKHARISWGSKATTDKAQIEKWWRWWPRAGLGIATGQRSRGIVVIDVDSRVAADALLRQFPHLPATRMASTGREGGGAHFYYETDQEIGNSSGDGLDFRGDGGMVVLPPSEHRTGAHYRWLAEVLPARLPADTAAWLVGRCGRARRAAIDLGARPAWLQGAMDLSERAARGIGYEPATLEDIAAALDLILNPDLGWDRWNRIAMTIWASCHGDDAGIALLDKWSAKSRKKYQPEYAEQRWNEIASCPPSDLDFGTLVFEARRVDPLWTRPSLRQKVTAFDPQAAQPATNGHTVEFPKQFSQENESNPLIQLNERYAVIGDLGGKCLVMSWVPSKVDPIVKVPSFQSFKSFSERYANKYVKIGEGDEAEVKQLGPHWLKWPRRKSYDGIDLIPEGTAPENYLNLWSGFAVQPAPGRWSLMQQHIGKILAGGDPDAAWYITRFAAWAVQHPGERAEVALVFRGGKGSGKGTFANALRRIFGQHGLQIFNSKHLVGAFNGHLRNCLLLFADEAFWAGDRQGESVLKGLITEQALMIEQKGVDAAPWRNRLHVIMAANADWVVPASHDERRYAVFDVSPDRINDEPYFEALHAEMQNGGLAHMLHDLQRLDLRGWHPRRIVKTLALRRQKELSMSPLMAWWESLLRDAVVPHDGNESAVARAGQLLEHFRQRYPHSRDGNAQAIGRFLRDHGCEQKHDRYGSLWWFPELKIARERFADKMGGWKWDDDQTAWRAKSGDKPSFASHPSHGSNG